MNILKIILIVFLLVLCTACKNTNYGACEPAEEIPKLTDKAEHGDTEAACRLRWHYEYCEEDNKQASYWLHKGASYGDVHAQFDLSCILLDKYVSHSDKDITEGIELLKKTAEQNYNLAQTILGDYFKEGKYVTQDWKQCEYWYRRAAKDGDTTGMQKLSDLLLLKKKTLPGLSESYKWATIIAYRSKPGSYHYQSAKQQQQAVIDEAEKININIALLKLKAENQAKNENSKIPQNIFSAPTCSDKYTKIPNKPIHADPRSAGR